MMKFKNTILLISIILISSVCFTSASSEILNPNLVHAAVSDLASVYGKTYPVQVDGKTYNIHYGFKFTYANVTNIMFVPVHNSIQIHLTGVTEDEAMWIQFPQSLIYAANNNFIVSVGEKEKKYELATSDHSIVMGFMVPENGTFVEIQGTSVVPEFPISATAALLICFMAMLFFGTKIMRKYTSLQI